MAIDREPESTLDLITNTKFDRRTLLKRSALLGLGASSLVTLLAACGDDDDDDPTPTTEAAAPEPTSAEEEAEDEEPTEESGEDEPTEAEDEEDDEPVDEAPAGEGVYGGRLVIANAGQPHSLDMHQPQGGRTLNLITWHIYESLFTWDAEYALMPQLAEGFETNDDATLFTIKLRQGVPFHNGQEMVAADVIASIERWAELASNGKILMAATEELVEVDDYTIEFRMSSPVATVPNLLARAGQGCAIYPKSVIDEAGTDFVSEYIGTGPYKFVDFQPDRFTLIERFDDYVQPPGESSGYAGRRNAYLDELEFRPVPDEAARIAGFESGEYHYLEEVIADQIDVMRQNPDLRVELLPPRSYGYIGINHRSPIMSNLKIRQAMQACMDIYPQGLASHGEGYFELGPGIMLPVTVWDSDAGSEYYDMKNPELAAQLLEEAGYDGTPIKWLTTQDDLGDYNSAVVASSQMEDAGFVIELIVVDEATLATERNKDDGWDVWNGAFILRTDPTLLQFVSSCDYSGFWCSDAKEEAFGRLISETSFEARYAAFEDIQRLFYEEVAAIKQQDNYGVMTVAAVVQNFGPDTTLFELEPEFTNCWLPE
jgi:peptide/nickel transport system substrate-binding protein